MTAEPTPKRADPVREHVFAAPVLFDPEVEDGYMKHFVPVPESVARALEAHGATRLIGSLDGRAFRRVLHRRPDGGRCLKFGNGWLKDAGLGDGDEVRVTLAPDPDPDAVDVPAELAEALDVDAEAALAWAALTPGKQRTMAYAVARAKRPQTRHRRARAVIEQLLSPP